MKSGIYTITNTVNNKIYVGFSYNMPRRMKEHLRKLVLNSHTNKHLQTAFNIYGQDCFEFEPLEYCEDRSILPSLEHYWVNTLSTRLRDFGYNVKPTSVDGRYVGDKLSDLTKSKISAAMKERPAGEHHHFYGRTGSDAVATKKVVDTLTGIVYPSVKEAALYLGCKFHTLRRKLNGGRKNNTTMEYLKNIQNGTLQGSCSKRW